MVSCDGSCLEAPTRGSRGKTLPPTDDAEEKDDGFPTLDGCLMIFGGSVAYDSKCRQKVTRREVYTTEPATPTFLRWSEPAITFNQTDHPERVRSQGDTRSWLTQSSTRSGSPKY